MLALDLLGYSLDWINTPAPYLGEIKMSPLLLRRVWTVIENTQASVLLELSDRDLIKQLLSQLSIQQSLSKEESRLIDLYLHRKIPLIRDVADANQLCL